MTQRKSFGIDTQLDAAEFLTGQWATKPLDADLMSDAHFDEKYASASAIADAKAAYGRAKNARKGQKPEPRNAQPKKIRKEPRILALPSAVDEAYSLIHRAYVQACTNAGTPLDPNSLGIAQWARDLLAEAYEAQQQQEQQQ